MGDKNILVFFKSIEQAQEAASQLKGLGVVDLQIEPLKSPQAGSNDLTSPQGGMIDNNTQMTLGLFNTGPDIRALFGADFSSSGLSEAQTPVKKDQDILLTVAVDKNRQDQAMEILKNAGGIF